MRDQYERTIEYLRLSVTDRCNLRCRYCMAEAGVAWKSPEEILSYEELERLVRLMVTRLGISHVRLTGGEPLVRQGIVDFARRLRAVPGLRDLSLSTNGLLLAEMAGKLRQAGVDRVNISLDTLRPERFREIARREGLPRVLAGVEAALKAGLEPVKLNCVALGGYNEDEVVDFARLTLDRPLHVRFIELMPLGTEYQWEAWRFVPAEALRRRIEAAFGPLAPGEVRGAGPARYLRIPGAVGTLGFITAMSQHFCADCNRVRLTADGYLNPCLGSMLATDLRAPLRAGAGDGEILRLLTEAISLKPERHQMEDLTRPENRQRRMSGIGG